VFSRSGLLISLALLSVLLTFLVLPGAIAQAQSGDSAASRDVGLSPSDNEQAGKAVDLFQKILDRLNSQQQPFGPPPPQPVPDTFLGEFESYLRDNAGAWYVVLTKLALAGALGLILALVYRASYTGKRKKYSPSLMQSQLLLSISGCLIWILVANYLVRAFGLAGMVGLIRYRTRVRDPKDNVMVFLSMAIGMACGLSQVTAAIVSTAFICLVLFGMHEFGLGKKKKKKKNKEAQPEEPSAPTADQD